MLLSLKNEQRDKRGTHSPEAVQTYQRGWLLPTSEATRGRHSLQHPYRSMSHILLALQCSTVHRGQAVANSSAAPGSTAHCSTPPWMAALQKARSHTTCSLCCSVSQQLRHTAFHRVLQQSTTNQAARSPASCHCLFQHQSPSAFPFCLFFKPRQQ